MNDIRPPKGYPSWLDYAIAAMETRSLHLQSFEEDEADWGRIVQRDEMRDAAKRELEELQKAQKELAAAYLELRKIRPAIKAVFDRAVWERAERDGKERKGRSD